MSECNYFCPGHASGHPDYADVQRCRDRIYEENMSRIRANRMPPEPEITAPVDSPTGRQTFTNTLHGTQDGPEAVLCARCGRPSRGLLVSDQRGRLVHEGRCNESGIA